MVLDAVARKSLMTAARLAGAARAVSSPASEQGQNRASMPGRPAMAARYGYSQALQAWRRAWSRGGENPVLAQSPGRCRKPS